MKDPATRTGLALSGGGFRASLFHLGVLRCLNDLGALRDFSRISSVSGGSITAGVLAHAWRELSFDHQDRATNFDERVTQPLRRFASHTLDIKAGVFGLLPFVGPASVLQKAYAKSLVGKATLQDLPSDEEGPRFIFNAANLQTGVLFRMSRPYMADWKLGQWAAPTLPLATAMAASSAFPPFFSPLIVKPGALPENPDPEFEQTHSKMYQRLCNRILLTDGGVYDNFGSEPLKGFPVVVLSDAGKRLEEAQRPLLDWFSQLLRIRAMYDDQVRALRVRWLAEKFDRQETNGVYFSMRGELITRGDWDNGTSASASFSEISKIPTRLKALPQAKQELLITCGAQHCLASLRKAKSLGALPGPLGDRV